MTKNAAQTTTSSTTTKPSKVQTPDLQKLRVGHELMDTAWRMTVPVVLFAGLGIFIDRSVGSKPWATLLGTVIGFVLAGLLVKRQIGDVPEFIPTNPNGPGKKPYDYDADDNDYYTDKPDKNATKMTDKNGINGKDKI